jgi:hypothetical protein
MPYRFITRRSESARNGKPGVACIPVNPPFPREYAAPDAAVTVRLVIDGCSVRELRFSALV